MNMHPSISSRIYYTIFVIPFSVLATQVMLTRLFSVILYYHFAFAIVSLAMMGLTIGSIIVYKKQPTALTGDESQAKEYLENIISAASKWLCIAVISCIFSSYFVVSDTQLLITSLVIFLPFFVYCGIAISFILTRYSSHVSKLYFFDLAGSAIGSIAILPLMELFGVINSLLIVAFLPILLCKTSSGNRFNLRNRPFFARFIFCLIILNTAMYMANMPNIGIYRAKGVFWPQPEYEVWNGYSRVAVYNKYDAVNGFGISHRFIDTMPKIKQRSIVIDGDAATFIHQFDGDRKKLSFFEYFISSSAYQMRTPKHVAVVGVGGGRDILTALYYNAEKITGIEVNRNIVSLLKGKYAEFSGNLHKEPGVEIINDDARSYITRSKDSYDLIQVSLIDTWAATSSGAFMLTENSIYTLEAWQTFLAKLSDNGMLSFTRWYKPGTHEGELFRLVYLGMTALKNSGIDSPAKHMAILFNKEEANVTLIVSKSEITSKESVKLEKYSQRMGFEMLFTPHHASDVNLSDLITKGTMATPIAEDISAPTDNRPFFFNMLKISSFSEIFNPENSMTNKSMIPWRIIVVVTGVSTILLFLVAIIIPLAWRPARQGSFTNSALFIAYFTSIGFGFMLIEVSMLQRLSIFLGHPTYSLISVLFALLVSSSLGTLSTKNVILDKSRVRMAVLVLVIATFCLVEPALINQLRDAQTIVRITTAFVLVSSVGFFLGMCFPLGMKLVERSNHNNLVPWLWGVNGAASVLGSVAAVILSMSDGIAATTNTAAFTYLVTAVIYILLLRNTAKAD